MNVTTYPAPPLPPGRPGVVITGFMGTGKSTVGRIVADRLGVGFVDLDEVVAARAGMAVADVITNMGEHAFRELERRALADAARLSGTVVATGGGGVLHDPEFRQLAGGSVVVVLTCEPAEILRRVSDGDRPLLRPDPATAVDALMRQRADRYAAAGRAIDTTGRAPEAVADEVIELFQEQHPEATLHLTV
ncbi:MAG TPA: shikimate kinase, partial [Candidatus Binatia bacterium]|nr:shikimate kinase [Candidatus Binatia bacterium]